MAESGQARRKHVTNKEKICNSQHSAGGCACSGQAPVETPVDEPSSRRNFLKNAGSLSVCSLLGTAALMTMSDDANANMEWAEWFQGNYRLMSEEEKAMARARLERRYSREYGKTVTVDGTPPQEGVLMRYALPFCYHRESIFLSSLISAWFSSNTSLYWRPPK